MFSVIRLVVKVTQNEIEKRLPIGVIEIKPAKVFGSGIGRCMQID